MLDVFGHGYPGMHPFLIDGECWRGEARFCENADGNGDTVVTVFPGEVDRYAASGAEGELGSSAFVADPHILRACTGDLDRLPWKPGLRREDAPGSTLACEAVADRHSDRVSRDFGRELAATARRNSKCHGDMFVW